MKLVEWLVKLEEYLHVENLLFGKRVIPGSILKSGFYYVYAFP